MKTWGTPSQHQHRRLRRSGIRPLCASVCPVPLCADTRACDDAQGAHPPAGPQHSGHLHRHLLPHLLPHAPLCVQLAVGRVASLLACASESTLPRCARHKVFCRAHSAKHSNSVVSGSHDVGLDAVAPLLNPILLSVTRACKAAKKCKAQVFLSAFYCAAFGCADFFFCAFYWELIASIAP